MIEERHHIVQKIIATWDDEKRTVPSWEDNKKRGIFKKCIQYHFSNEDKVLAFYNCTLQSVWDGTFIAESIRYHQKIRMEKYKNFKQSLEAAELFLECIDVEKINDKRDFFNTRQLLEGQWGVFHTLPLELQNLLSEKIPNGK